VDEEAAKTRIDDPAAMAFDELRGEVTTLRITIQRLAAAPSEIVIPDYTETLTEIRGAAVALVSHYKKLRDAPALSVTPDQLTAQINAASAEARKAESQSLQNAENSFVTIARELTGFVESARTAEQQNKWTVGGFVFGFATCAALVILGAGWNSAEPAATTEAPPAVHKSR